ncbi:unnamed protein product [Dicrocoelium dendriticum]|nr:unnamed protein product [Dicrocoelium dendriticum]CAH8633852.1 unnamed protein product [Dicrocoelium dendriticum]
MLWTARGFLPYLNRFRRCPSRLLRKLVGYNTDVTGDSDRNSSARPSRLCSEDLLDWCLNNSLTELFHPLSNRRGKGEERMSNSNPIEVYASHLLDEKPIKPDKVLCDLIQKVSKQDSSKTLKRMLIDDAIDSDRTTPHFGMPSPRKKGNSKMSSEHVDMDEYDTDVHSTCGINEFPENTHHLLNLTYGSPRATSSGLPAGAVSENASSGFDAVIDLALASEEAGSFDLPELHEAFLKFFEEGAVSDELDDYFTKFYRFSNQRVCIVLKPRMAAGPAI